VNRSFRKVRRKTWSLAAGVLVVSLAACGGGGDDDSSGGGAFAQDETAIEAPASGSDTPPAETPSGGGGSDIPSPCLDEGSIGSAIGFPVTVAYDTLRVEGEAVSCSYQGNGGEGFVQILVGPDSATDEVLGEVEDKARAMSGAEAQAIDVGERGLAFGSPDASYAAAVDGYRVFAVSVSSATSADLVGDKREAVADILQQVIAVED
jgi:hypothetical protein